MEYIAKQDRYYVGEDGKKHEISFRYKEDLMEFDLTKFFGTAPIEKNKANRYWLYETKKYNDGKKLRVFFDFYDGKIQASILSKDKKVNGYYHANVASIGLVYDFDGRELLECLCDRQDASQLAASILIKPDPQISYYTIARYKQFSLFSL